MKDLWSSNFNLATKGLCVTRTVYYMAMLIIFQRNFKELSSEWALFCSFRLMQLTIQEFSIFFNSSNNM